MTNLREAVARAICDANGDDPDEIVFRDRPRWRLHTDSADAAIAAVLEAMERPGTVIFALKETPKGRSWGAEAIRVETGLDGIAYLRADLAISPRQLAQFRKKALGA